MFPAEVVAKEAVRLAESDGIVFIDEIDKIVPGRDASWRGGDPSSEGVQRDLLPIIEGEEREGGRWGWNRQRFLVTSPLLPTPHPPLLAI